MSFLINLTVHNTSKDIKIIVMLYLWAELKQTPISPVRKPANGESKLLSIFRIKCYFLAKFYLKNNIRSFAL